jgi:SSS family solute:Na+ symporter
MAVCFALCLIVMAGITLVKPLAQPVVFEKNTAIALESSRVAKIGGVVVIATAILFYFLFSPLGLAG